MELREDIEFMNFKLSLTYGRGNRLYARRSALYY